MIELMADIAAEVANTGPFSIARNAIIGPAITGNPPRSPAIQVPHFFSRRVMTPIKKGVVRSLKINNKRLL